MEKTGKIEWIEHYNIYKIGKPATTQEQHLCKNNKSIIMVFKLIKLHFKKFLRMLSGEEL